MFELWEHPQHGFKVAATVCCMDSEESVLVNIAGYLLHLLHKKAGFPYLNYVALIWGKCYISVPYGSWEKNRAKSFME
ncbi:hypothetical protein K7432_001797 [Basidiobolus ranarum]|uniref:Uncharacterized protein n=1 Tax=Basidiobolus ranarum TaxID=34480 RepID=A0ABR2W8X9_9FUNG